MRTVRLLLVGVGGVVLVSGLALLPWTAFPSLPLWSVGLVLLHDGLWAPAVIAAGWLGARHLPAPARTPALVGALVSVTLVLLALPVLGSGDRRPDNPTVLDRDYTTGLLVALGLTWALAGLAALAGSRRRGPAGSARPPRRFLRSPP